MKKVRKYFWLKSAGLLSILIVFLLGSSSCRRRQMTKYGPPSDYGYDEPVTKYGIPVDYDESEFDEIQENDTTATILENFYYDETQGNDTISAVPQEYYYEETATKYGVPPDYDDIIEKSSIEEGYIDTTNNLQ